MKEILNFLSALTSGKISTTSNAINKCQQRSACKNHLKVNFGFEEVPPNLHLGAGEVKETESDAEPGSDSPPNSLGRIRQA